MHPGPPSLFFKKSGSGILETNKFKIINTVVSSIVTLERIECLGTLQEYITRTRRIFFKSIEKDSKKELVLTDEYFK
jgi:hypothetical protein